MTILVGYPPNLEAPGVLTLAQMLARSTGEDLLVCTVSQDPNAAQLIGDVEAETVVVPGKSVANTLIDVAQQAGASMIVVGSAKGVIERVTVSSVADRLLHLSPLPVAITTRGFRGTDGPISRLTLGFVGDVRQRKQMNDVGTLASYLHAELRFASFAVNIAGPAGLRGPMLASAVLREWEEVVRRRFDFSVSQIPDIAAREPELAVGMGYDWADAIAGIEWRPDDVLVVGSSHAGPLSRVFVGKRSTKIMRNSSVPVIALPR